MPRTRRPQPVHFYPRPPRGGRPATALHRGKAAVFLSTPSARRATFWRFRNGLCDEISIHALREEGDFLTPAPMPRRPNFYPRPPRGGRHYLTNMSMAYFQFLSTPSARRATSKSRPSIKPETFLSTPSARRATRYPGGDGSRLGDFYPRPPRGGRPRLRTRASLSWYFYPRPPRGGRLRLVITYSGLYDFYPRPPRGGRHQQTGSSVGCTVISIHALREEGDIIDHEKE